MFIDTVFLSKLAKYEAHYRFCFAFSYDHFFVVHIKINNIFKPPSLSELTPMILDMDLTHLGSEASIFSSYIEV